MSETGPYGPVTKFKTGDPVRVPMKGIYRWMGDGGAQSFMHLEGTIIDAPPNPSNIVTVEWNNGRRVQFYAEDLELASPSEEEEQAAVESILASARHANTRHE